MTPVNFHEFNCIVVNSSGGKDSQTALRLVVHEADRQGYPRHRIIVSHQDLGRMEWPGTKELALLQAACYKLEVEVESYVSRRGERMSLLDYALRRGKWPGSQQRWCTSELKRGPGNKVVTRVGWRFAVDGRTRVLQVFGFRAEESPSRAKRKALSRNERVSCQRREVMDWLPIHDWTEQQVWDDIHDSGVPYHWAYDIGMPRLSCVFCIFAPKGALMRAAKANPELFLEYLDAERRMGHDFKHDEPLRLIAEALARGEEPPPVTGAWNM